MFAKKNPKIINSPITKFIISSFSNGNLFSKTCITSLIKYVLKQKKRIEKKDSDINLKVLFKLFLFTDYLLSHTLPTLLPNFRDEDCRNTMPLLLFGL